MDTLLPEMRDLITPQTEGQVAWETEELDAGTSQVFDSLAWKHFFLFTILFYNRV